MQEIARYESESPRTRARNESPTKRITINLYNASIDVAERKERWLQNAFRSKWGEQIKSLRSTVSLVDFNLKETKKHTDDDLAGMKAEMCALHSMVWKLETGQNASRGRS
eukprot:GEMP01033382.1.p2 GENE.GEMP01033382.1~~GEMP01033382.1.p2  ORF type:complete len:110 (+),score=18.55 GEMP01033382.1:1081-1410(+)